MIMPRLFTNFLNLSPFHLVFPKIVISAAYEQNEMPLLSAHAEISIKDTKNPLKGAKSRFIAKFRSLDNHMERSPDEICLIIFLANWVPRIHLSTMFLLISAWIMI